MSAPKDPVGAPGPDEEPEEEKIRLVRLTIQDFFDQSFFEYCWWKKGAIERKSRIILVGRLVPIEKPNGEKEEEDGEGEAGKEETDTEDETTHMFHRMLHRLPDFCNLHTVVLLSDRAAETLCKAVARPLPRLFVLDDVRQEWVMPTIQQYTSWVQIAASDELKTYPILSHSNWTIK